MQRNKRSVKQWFTDEYQEWLAWWRLKTTDPDPKVTDSFRMYFCLCGLLTLLFSFLAMFAYTGSSRLVHSCWAALCGGVAALCYAVLQERRRLIP
jgi:hypothetical protein